jgi:hypothetical protein
LGNEKEIERMVAKVVGNRVPAGQKTFLFFRRGDGSKFFREVLGTFDDLKNTARTEITGGAMPA